jgi:hypothetical protein
MEDSGGFRNLAGYRRCAERLTRQWASFCATRADRLRHGGETERVAEAIIEDLFTEVLDWSKGDISYQIEFADIVISKNLAKYLVIEVKRPGTLWPGRQRLVGALDQARKYADQQRVPCIAASDGRFLYARDIEAGAEKDRVLLDLAGPDPPPGLWWLSVHGIYRPCEERVHWSALPDMAARQPEIDPNSDILHPKYKLPASCFAYVGDAGAPHTWKLPYRQADGQIDSKRLPKAIQALLSNYRGAKVGGIPEKAIGEVLKILARAAADEGRMPPRATEAGPIYCELARVLEQQDLSIEEPR